MSEKRRDHRGRILHNGEIQLFDGRYRFKYVDEMEKKIQADQFDQIVTNGGNMTVLELVEKIYFNKSRFPVF